ncbi:MAG TPA: TetR/AcrR family transcriptional regulator [Saprospiraceae bacterium]|nr:TetR/AcrR family transcriptional regulator [Saprospiraceae bacterium]HMP13384.1 TetR/AcrR family transcriptional regulator [Saprospiraceae bacterium]
MLPNSIDTDKSKRQIIFEAAAQLFRDKGYSATSMRDLAQKVNLKASSLYNHIGSKEEILSSICFSNAKRFRDGMQQVEQMPGSPMDKVRMLIRLHVEVATEDLTSVTAFNDEWRHLSEPLLTEFKTMRKDYENRFQRIIESGIQSGAFRALDSFTVLYTILSSIRWLHDWYRPNRQISPEELYEQMTTLLLKGLVK